jgi:hypothetical protein
MCRIALLAAVATVSFAQNASAPAQKPPAKVDQALRARVNEFYRYHMTEEYRKAEKLVARDTLELYYVRSKPKYEAFEIEDIEYSEKFKKAKVSTRCEQFIQHPVFKGKMKMSCLSWWKIEGGKWMWHIPKEELTQGALGKMTPGPKPGAGPADVGPANIPTTPDYALGKVKPDKTTLLLKPRDTQQFSIINGSTNDVSITLAQALPDIELAFDKANLKPGESCVVTVKTGENPLAGTLAFRIGPLHEIIEIKTTRR